MKTTKYVVPFEAAASAGLSRVGGKGLNLGELFHVGGLCVPPGICITTDAYNKVANSIPALDEAIRGLDALSPEDRDGISNAASRVRAFFENARVPDDVAFEVIQALDALKSQASGSGAFYGQVRFAVRSSATAEDLPDASFAGQQDTYLNVPSDAVLTHVCRCWASLFTDRAVTYRIRAGLAQSDLEHLALSVIIQLMVFPHASGILFTADPLSGNRKISVVDAGFGLGEAMVSGIVSADNYRVRDGRILDKKIHDKKIQIIPCEDGGTREEPVPINLQTAQVLTDEQISELCRLGREIEDHFCLHARKGRRMPQDIEWCLTDGRFHILQSRPITTLYPLPEGNFENELHVFVCIGHVQMMTDPVLPLGFSFFRALGEEYANMISAGGRLYLDASSDLKSWLGQKTLLYSFGETDILIRNILRDLIGQRDFVARLGKSKSWLRAFKRDFSGWLWNALKVYLTGDMSGVQRVIARREAMIAAKRDAFAKLSEAEPMAVFDVFERELSGFYKEMVSGEDVSYLLLWFYSHSWLRKNLGKWLCDERAVDILSKSVPNNPTSEMGLALLDISHLVRKSPAAAEYLARAQDKDFIEGLREADGEVAEAFFRFLEKYGTRCSGEIDITKPRWNERPTALVPMIKACLENSEATSGAVHFEKGRAEAEEKAAKLIERIEKLPGGRRKAKKMRKMISIWRGVSGFREYPKFFMIQYFGIYKEALMKVADKLVQRGIICEREDIFYLTLEELREATRSGLGDLIEIRRRRREYEFFEKLTPPRVMTSEGEILRGSYGSSLYPEGALVGMPVSSGVVEGTARVVLRQKDANIREGDILVTPFTDPSWTPFFVSIKGLVTEVGGQMTHGAVITREYGLPAVVGVEDATKIIVDGQKIRVNGTEGWVELL